MKRWIVFMSVVFALFACECRADGIGTLLDIARSQKGMAKERAEETRNYESAKRAVENGSIAKGKSKKDVRSRCGEPVVIIEKEYGRSERWVYKPSKSSFFEGEKITLYFGEDDTLDEIEVKA